MKKILVAVDSFKGSMTSIEAGKSIEKGIKSVLSGSQVRVRPVADGGEGTTEALIYGRESVHREECVVTDPLGEKCTAAYVTYDSADGKVAVMEMAAAAGLPLVPVSQRNPMRTTTYGVGEMIRDAIEKGCSRFIIGIGGSATNDGGVGMLQALGFSCLDAHGYDVPYGAAGLESIDRIVSPCDTIFADKLSGCDFRIACDVTNPLVGELGCSRVFAPQKGADAEMVELMDGYMKHYADVVEKTAGTFNRNTPGAGAAGGIGYAFLMFLGGKLMQGIDIVLSEIGLESDVEWADTVITGEGRIDAQTMMGKTPSGVAKLAKKHGKYVIAIGGCLGEGAESCVKAGVFDECYSVNDVLKIDVGDAEQVRLAMEHENAMANLELCTSRIVELREKRSRLVCRPPRLK